VQLHHLVTGGAGFVGSHLTDALIARGHTVTVLDDLSTGRLENLDQHKTNPSLTFVEGSILDVPLVNSLVAKADHVFHLAAAVGVFNIVQNPLKSLSTNIRGSENVLEACATNKVPVLVTSTSEIYGKNTSDALGEEDDRILGSPLKVRWSYSEAKAIEEVLAYSYWHSEGLPARIVRLFNTVGPRQVGFYGMVVPRFVGAALKNEPITVYGDGTQTRCFAHVSDVIDALLKVAGTDKTIGTVVNIGNNFEISILDLAKKIIEITGSKSEITFVNYADAYEAGFEDMQRRVPSTQRLVSLTGWKVTKSLEEIIRDVAADLAK
jgi:UDP-glucose 4-epimerase